MSRRVLFALLFVIAGTATCSLVDAAWTRLWPPLVALLVIVVTRHAFFGLLAGGLSGAVMLAGGDPAAAIWAVLADHLAPSLRDSWKQGAVVFTFVLGGFAAVLEGAGDCALCCCVLPGPDVIGPAGWRPPQRVWVCSASSTGWPAAWWSGVLDATWRMAAAWRGSSWPISPIPPRRRWPVCRSSVFLTGAAVSFSTGTSWGTMGLLFPLAVPAAAPMGVPEDQLPIIVAAVFSGAVFGDHCSPFSDTTIVTSISCGVEPHDHVRTQIHYALITAVATIGLGFLPAGRGIPAAVCLIAGTLGLILLPTLARRFGRGFSGSRGSM